MNLYDLISKIITDEYVIELSQEKIDSICHKYQISDNELKKYISVISKHKYLKKIDIQDDMKKYYNCRENDVTFVKQFEKLLNSEKIQEILQIIQNRNFSFDLRKIGVSVTAWADTQLFLQALLLQKIYCFLIMNQDKIYDYKFIDKYLDEIIKKCKVSLSFEDLLCRCDNALFKNIVSKNNGKKDKCLITLKKNFIDKGYCFHGFNNQFEDQILKHGLSGDLNCCNTSEMLKIDNIFRNYNMNGVFQQNWSYQQNPNFFTTDNFGAAYYYSVLSPVFMSRLVSNGNYMLNENVFDRTAFIQRDVNACINNINALLTKYDVLATDSDYIKKYIENYLEFLFQCKDNLKIAFFPRSEINRDFSDNYDKAILMQSELSIDQLLKIAIKPSFEIDRHQNTTYDSSIISSITIPNYAKSLIKKRN